MTSPRRWRCPGKMFWLGEYAVLYGAPAVVAAVDRYADVRLAPRADAAIVVQGSTLQAPYLVRDDAGMLHVDAPPAGGELIAAVAGALQRAGRLRASGADVQADTSALSIAAGDRKLGLGSSGAAAAGLARALGAWSPDETAELAALAVEAHRAFQGGRGSGADVVASVYGGLTIQQSGAAPEPVAPPAGLEFVAIDTGVSASTTALVQAVRDRHTTDPAGGDAVFAALQAIATAGATALRGGDVSGWLDAAGAYCEAERALAAWSGAALFPAPVERALAAATDAGWVAKPSGAGGGDVVVAFARTGADPARIREACDAAGVAMLPLALSHDGANTRPA